MRSEEARRRFVQAPVARLATVGVDGRPHLVPLVFAVVEDTVYSAVDAKPKRTSALRRLENVSAHPAVALLADHYDDDWSRLWWVRADGEGRIIAADHAEARDALLRLASRYTQYAERPPPGPVLAVDVTRWSGWSGGDAPE